MDDDQEGQIKKKKRLILLLLLTLLVGTAGAAALLEPAASTTVAALETSPAPPEQTTSPNANTFMATTAPSPVQGDEWTRPTFPGADSSGTPALVGTNDNVASSPNLIPTTESQAGPPPTKPKLTPTSSDANEEATSEFEIRPTGMMPTPASPSIAEAPPSITLPDSNVRLTATPAPQREAPLTSDKVIPTEISKRINESWDILDGSYISPVEAVNASLPLTATTTLTNPPTLSETITIAPPDGLPVTGIISRHGMNWTAMLVVVLLVGAGVAALLDPRKRPK